MTNKNIFIHHIGGRSGNMAFPSLKYFEKDFTNVLYEADVTCIEQIKDANKNSKSKTYVLPYCISNICKSANFNINYDPYTSSLHDINPAYNLYYFSTDEYDYTIEETTKTVKKIQIETYDIDTIFSSKELNIQPPDFLSLDTQGSEYEILEGAQQTLKSSVVALVLEVEFHQLYKDQKLFGDISKKLSDLGFDFVKFLQISEMSPFRGPTSLRSEGYQICADALFLRRLDNTINKSEELNYKQYVMLRKAAFIAIIYNQFEYGIECLNRSRNIICNHNSNNQDEPTYERFLKDLETQIEKMYKVYPKTFSSTFTFDESNARFQTSITSARFDTLKKIPLIIPILKLGFTTMCNILMLKNTNVERILLNYGLKTQVKTIKEKRVKQTMNLIVSKLHNKLVSH